MNIDVEPNIDLDYFAILISSNNLTFQGPFLHASDTFPSFKIQNPVVKSQKYKTLYFIISLYSLIWRGWRQFKKIENCWLFQFSWNFSISWILNQWIFGSQATFYSNWTFSGLLEIVWNWIFANFLLCHQIKVMLLEKKWHVLDAFRQKVIYILVM